jgi:hypothetical protein
MIAFLRLTVMTLSLAIVGMGFFELLTNPFPLMLPLLIMGSGIFMFLIMAYRVGEVD